MRLHILRMQRGLKMISWTENREEGVDKEDKWGIIGFVLRVGIINNFLGFRTLQNYFGILNLS